MKTPEQLQKEAKEWLNFINQKKNLLTPKERAAIPPQEMPQQPPEIRITNMNEVALGYSEEQAKVEAARCLQCKNAPCIQGCPVRIRIPDFIREIANGNYRKAIEIIRENSLLPAVCGRVCPQEVQCQQPCTLGKIHKNIDKAVSIGRLERFVADWEINNGLKTPATKPDTGKKVAIIGSGPAGITAAADIRREGHSVVMYEALHKAGGVLMYGIPEFRLPKKIVEIEINNLKAMGVIIINNFIIGKTRKLQDLLDKDGFDAVFIGTGAGLPKFMNIPGENLVGVFSANEFLTRSNLMKAYAPTADTPIVKAEKVAVLGGGNVAMDTARTAVRLGAKEVHLIYRRTEVEMPARIEEVRNAREEGVIFHFLQNCKRIIGDKNDKVVAMECLRYELGEPDSSGRRRPIEIKGSEFIMEIDVVIVAIGNESNPLIKKTTPAINTNKYGNIIVDEETGKTSLDRVYAGGDIVRGAATVILAMGEGRRAATAINELLSQYKGSSSA